MSSRQVQVPLPLPLPLRLARSQNVWVWVWLGAVTYGLLAWALFANKVQPAWVGLLVTVAAAVAAGLCWRWPIVACTVAVACFWVSPWTTIADFLALPPLVMALYRVASHASLRTSAALGGLALSGPVATALPDFAHTGAVAPFGLSLVAAWAVGYATGQRRRYAATALQHQLAQQRMQLARELHDVVAHSMSVIAVQAGFGHLVGPDKPQEAVAALAVIESTSRQTLTELRQLLGVLRQDHDEAALAPAPGLADLGRLVPQAAAGGVAVHLHTGGELDQVPAGIALAAYRIVQEALTNVIKHARTDTAHVQLASDGSTLLIEVRDNGETTAGQPVIDGHGLIGMRERAAMYGGWVRAQPAAGHGFEVIAQLPLPKAAE